MEQSAVLVERVRTLKFVAATMQEGAIHTELIPEIDKILALPERFADLSTTDYQAIERQVSEYEQSFDRLGYSLLDQLMPSTGVSSVFEIVSARDRFRRDLQSMVGRTVEVDGKPLKVDQQLVDALTRYSLSIGTPPVTDGMKTLVGRTLFGGSIDSLTDHVEMLDWVGVDPYRLLALLRDLVDSSSHYCTAAEEREFLREAGEFINCEGGRLFNRVVITEGPDRVIDLIRRHVFDKMGANEVTPVRLVEQVDAVGLELINAMRAEPNMVFVARITRLPHRVFSDRRWLSVIGRLILIDCSRRAQQSNTTIVYTLFPHVAATLRNVQTSFAGRPANTQLQLRRALEQFPPATLRGIRQAIERRLATLESEGPATPTVEEILSQEWSRSGLLNYLELSRLRRTVAFIESVATAPEGEAPAAEGDLRQRVADGFMRYFYGGLPAEVYRATVVPGGGRGALTLVGEHHRDRTRADVERFTREQLGSCRERLNRLKSELEIPDTSTDEIEAAIKQSQLRALSPTQWRMGDKAVSRKDYLASSIVYRAASAAGRLADRTRERLDRAAYGNVTGGAAALIKRAMRHSGFGALHGRLERVVGDRVGQYDRRLRDVLAPFQEAMRLAQRSLSDLKGELDPVAVAEIEAVLNVIEQGFYYPTLILPEMSWTYHDVFPDKDYPAHCTIRIPLNERHEADPLALLAQLEALRYQFRQFGEVFELFCRSALLVLNTPHNPTGVVYRRETVLKLLQIASEFGITVVDDNAYNKILTREHKAREGDLCAAQLYEIYRESFSRPVRIITVGATTKGLQGAGDRTGVLHANDPEVIAYVERHGSRAHQMSLFISQLKLESGLAAKRYTREIEEIAAQLLAPTAGATPLARLRQVLEQLLATRHEPGFPVAVFETLLGGYERLLRLQQRGATMVHLSRAASDLQAELKQLRIERRLRNDVQRRLEQARMALLRVSGEQGAAPLPHIEPQGAFYCCVRLSESESPRGMREFLAAIAAARGVDFTIAGNGYVRMSLGGPIVGDQRSYDQLGLAIETFTRLLRHYWGRYEAAGRSPEALATLFDRPAASTEGTPPDAAPKETRMAAAIGDLWPLVAAHARPDSRAATRRGLTVEPSERGLVYCIEEGRSVSDKVFIEIGDVCETVEELLRSRAFRVLYRRLLKRVHQQLRSTSLSYPQLENKYGPLACLEAYRDRQLIDDAFREVLQGLYAAWHGADTNKVLIAQLRGDSHKAKMAALNGINRRLNQLINELMYAFGVPEAQVKATDTFEFGLEALVGLEPSPQLPRYLQEIVAGATFAGATTALNPAPRYTTGAVKRVADYRYGFIRREAHEAPSDPPGSQAASSREAPPLAFFQQQLARLAGPASRPHYICKAVQVGPFKMLLVIHKSCCHLINDELRLFPQIEAVQRRDNLSQLRWDGVLLFGVPVKLVGDAYKTGYIFDRCSDGELLPTAWVAREDATDYVGFLKKSLLTLHNERVKAMGGMPVHGAMITVTFKNGLRKTLVFSADSGTGKSETITAMMEQMIGGGRLAAELDRVDILAGDMLSLWRGTDEQVYAFGTETGDFMRLTDVSAGWQRQFGDLLKRGSYSNLHFAKNPRVTIPGICDARQVLTPTRVNGFFYINNYDPSRTSSVDLIEDPHQVLTKTLVRGLRKNKGTSGDQPSLRAGLEYAGNSQLVVRYRHLLDQLLVWESEQENGRERNCLAFRDGAGDVWTAREVVTAAFKGKRVAGSEGGEGAQVTGIDYAVMSNRFWLQLDDRRRLLLDRDVYDQIYQPLVSTFCGNPFVDPAGMDHTLSIFAETMRRARVHTGVIKTQLARAGEEYAGPAKAARDIVEFLLEDEEVNARFQRNKQKVHLGMQLYGEVTEAGAALPVELEGYNLLLLEEHESSHVEFLADDRAFSVPTPFYRYAAPEVGPDLPFVPAIALPEQLQTIIDICENPDYELPLGELEVDLSEYESIRFWNGIEELTFQVLLLDGVIKLGLSEKEVARFPLEVRKARHIAELIVKRRDPVRTATGAARLRAL